MLADSGFKSVPRLSEASSSDHNSTNAKTQEPDRAEKARFGLPLTGVNGAAWLPPVNGSLQIARLLDNYAESSFERKIP